MARKLKPANETNETNEAAVEARTLVDFHHDGQPIKGGTLITASAEAIAVLARDGLVDPHPDAVAAIKIELRL